jgi:hypothetical protein
LLEQLAARRPAEPRRGAKLRRGDHDVDVRAYCAKHDIAIRREKPWVDGATVFELDACVFNPDHNRGEAAIIKFASGVVLYKCQHASCAEKTWRDMREQFEPDDGAENAEGKSPRPKANVPSQATRLVELAAQTELFHTPDQEPCVTIVTNDHAETWRLKSQGFRLWLRREFQRATGKIPSAQATQDAVQTLMGRALFDGPEHPVFIRLAEHDGAIYLDRGDPDWMAIRIGPTGWEVVKNPPVKFRRARGMLPLPIPVHGWSLTDLAPFINIWDEPMWRLVVAWLVGACCPHGPYPILVLNGEQGSGKSTVAKVLRKLIDPHKVLLRRPPRDERDLMIATGNGWVISLDNLSYLPPWLSDALCNLATGGGFATRELYTDEDEVLFDATRPIIVNGIEEIATRGDLLDRTLLVTLPDISAAMRQAERKFWSAFEAERPGILGALLDAVAAAICNLPHVELERRPRMADFAEWVTAAEPGLGWASSSFMAAYSGNRQDATALTLDANPVAAKVCKLAADGGFEGTMTELLAKLNKGADEVLTRQGDWPKTARGLGGQLRRLVPGLRAVGVQVEFSKGHHPRTVRISTVPAVPTVPDGSRSEDGWDAPTNRGDQQGNGRDALGDARGPVGTERDGGDEDISFVSDDEEIFE